MNNSKFVDYFDKIYIINLESRADRRTEIEVELKKINLSITHPKIKLFKAIKPVATGEFPSIGARGCFLSHLGVLKDAKYNKYQRILIFEDDLDLNISFHKESDLVLNDLVTTDWDIFYGDYRIKDFSLKLTGNSKKIDFDLSVGTADFIGFNGSVIDKLIDYFEVMMNRKGGDILGGPMHVDGAYTWFRKDNPNTCTIVATPKLGYQRSSASDIADFSWRKIIPFKKTIITFYKRLKRF